MKRIVLVSHDAGGGNVLASLATTYAADFEWKHFVAGPAAGIFASAMVRREKMAAGPLTAGTLQEISPDLVLTGTGWQSAMEIDAMALARSAGIPCVAYLDHWTNYPDRFGDGRTWQDNLPDFIAVGDGYAWDQACQDGFPVSRLMRIENPYMRRIAGMLPARPAGGTARVLYLSEPFDPHFVPAGYSDTENAGLELRTVEMLLKLFGERLELAPYSLDVRLHPSEPANKYDYLIAASGMPRERARVHLAADVPLEEDCRRACCVVGIRSMALLISASTDCRTISFSPAGMRIGLPHAAIRRCHDVEALVAYIGGAPQPAEPLDLRLCQEPFPAAVDAMLNIARGASAVR